MDTDNQINITPIKVKPENKLKVLSEDQLDKLHQATLTVLQQTGVKFPSTKALQIFSDHGAQVDFENQIVKLSPDMVEEALDKAPRTYTLGSRTDPSLDLVVDRENSFLTTDGCGTTVIDFETKERRPSRKSDVEQTAIIADYLSLIGFYWPMVSAQDQTSCSVPLHELDAAYRNTEKHVQPETVMGEKPAQYAVEMAKVIAGSEKKMRERPPLSCLICSIDPLAQDKEGIEAGLVFAEFDIPVGFMAMPTMCSTGPAYVAGTMVVGNVEIISALTLIQLAHPGAPVFYSLLPQGMMNPYTGGYCSEVPVSTVLNTANVEMGHYYNLPVLAGTFGESVTFCGADLQVGVGLREESTLLHLPNILIDYEEMETHLALAQGIEVNQSTLALDEIMEVGPRGQFLTQPSTKDNLRKLWHPGITHQWSKEEGDFKDPQQVAIEKIEWILDNHKPKPLSKHKREELDRIIKAAEKELGNG